VERQATERPEAGKPAREWPEAERPEAEEWPEAERPEAELRP
jgi:hypothetical protein